MSETKAIRAVETIRRIRDEQARQLAGKSEAEAIEFFKRAGQRARQELQDRLSAPGEAKKEQPATQS